MFGSELDTTQKILQRIHQYDKDFNLMGDTSTNFNLNETNNMHNITNIQDISAIFPHQQMNFNTMTDDIGETRSRLPSGYYSPP